MVTSVTERGRSVAYHDRMAQRLKRRSFLRIAMAAVASVPAGAHALAQKPPEASGAKLPRWRGFNLLEMYLAEKRAAFRPDDFQWIADWGFDFVRLPMSYRAWTRPGGLRELDEDWLREIDRAVELGRKHRVHVNLNFHRAPGYCVNPPREPLSLWTDADALDACAFHWSRFARRYKGISSSELSFDLLNEPAEIAEEAYVRVVKHLTGAIRAEDPARLIIADGLRWGRDPVHGLVDLGVGQSTRGYDPMGVSHYKASWVGGERWPEPTWPLASAKGDAKDVWDKERLRKERIAPWKDLERKGVGVHVGEWGAFHHTPHCVALAWMRDQLELWKEAGWGWSLWNFRGAFGILDSERKDVNYEDFHGHKLDRAMLELLRQGS